MANKKGNKKLKKKDIEKLENTSAIALLGSNCCEQSCGECSAKGATCGACSGGSGTCVDVSAALGI